MSGDSGLSETHAVPRVFPFSRNPQPDAPLQVSEGMESIGVYPQEFGQGSGPPFLKVCDYPSADKRSQLLILDFAP